MSSQRLPGKVLMCLGDKPLLTWVVTRAQRISPLAKVAVLVGDRPENKPILDWCRSAGIKCLSGPEDDVLARYIQAAREMDVKTIVRLTGDNPIIDDNLISALLTAHHANQSQYSSNKTEFGSRLPDGIGAEIFCRDVLEELNDAEPDNLTKEHLNEFILANPEKYNYLCIKEPADHSNFNFSIDTLEDLQRVQNWLNKLSWDQWMKSTLWKSIVSLENMKNGTDE